MPKLKDYSETTGVNKKYIKSGFKSGDTDAELSIIEPLVEHPEIPGMYRAIDTTSGWKGWVEYSPVIEPVNPGSEETKRKEFAQKFRNLKKTKEYLEMDLISQEDYDAAKAGVVALGKEVGEL